MKPPYLDPKTVTVQKCGEGYLVGWVFTEGEGGKEAVQEVAALYNKFVDLVLPYQEVGGVTFASWVTKS